MTDRPILMKPELVAAILAGRKTQTLRLIKPQPVYEKGEFLLWKPAQRQLAQLSTRSLEIPQVMIHRDTFRSLALALCPYGAPGDRLWVRERHWFVDAYGKVTVAWFSDGGYTIHPDVPLRGRQKDPRIGSAPSIVNDAIAGRPARPSIHMPKWACRLRLDITEVRVERVRDISNADVFAEGRSCTVDSPDFFPDTWDAIHGKGAWERNDWVWVIGFKRSK